MSVGSVVYDEDWRIVRANAVALSLLQRPRLVGLRHEDLIAGHECRKRLIRRQDLPASVCRQLRLPDGGPRDFLLHYADRGAYTEATFEPLDGTLGLLDQLTAAMATADEAGFIVWANPAMASLCGLPAGHLVGRRVEGLLGRLGSPAPRADGAPPLLARLSGLVSAQGPDHDRRVLSLQRTAWRYRGLVCGTIVTAFDVTEFSDARLEAVGAVWQRLGARIRHELGNRLQTLQAAAAVLGPHVRPQGAAALGCLRRELEGTSRYVTEHIRPPRPEALAAVRLSAVVDVAIERARADLTTCRLRFEHVRPAQEPCCHLDSPSFRRAFTHLFRNAAAARTDACVRVAYTTTPDAITCTVCDDGPGFPADHTAHCLRRAVQGTASHLGLAIVASVLQSHGGAIDMTNLPQGGACVRLRLPAGLGRVGAVAGAEATGETWAAGELAAAGAPQYVTGAPAGEGAVARGRPWYPRGAASAPSGPSRKRGK